MSSIDELRDNSFCLAKIEIRATKDGLMVDATYSSIAYEALSAHGKELVDNSLSRAVGAIQHVLEESYPGKSTILEDNRTTEEWDEVIDGD